MRVIAFVQVLLLLLLLLYLLLVALENPQLVRLPLPSGGEWLLPVGGAVAVFALLGAVYAAFLVLPALLQRLWKHQQTKRALTVLETRFAQTLQARLSTAMREERRDEKREEKEAKEEAQAAEPQETAPTSALLAQSATETTEQKQGQV